MNAWAPRALCSAEGVLLFVCESVVLLWGVGRDPIPFRLPSAASDTGSSTSTFSLLSGGGIPLDLGPRHTLVMGAYFSCLFDGPAPRTLFGPEFQGSGVGPGFEYPARPIFYILPE